MEDLIDPRVIMRLAERVDRLAAAAADRPRDQYVLLEQPFQAAADAGAAGAGAVRKLYQLARTDEVLRGYAFGDRLVDVIADLLASDDLISYS